MPIIQDMIVQSGGSRAHVRYIMTALAMQFPTIIWKLGGRVDRLTRGGHVSAHSSGRAIDIYLQAHRQPDKELGERLFAMFVNYAAKLKVEHVIWNSREWSPANGGTYKTIPPRDPRGPHTDHLHVAFADDNLDAVPAGLLGPLFRDVRRWLRLRGYQDWLDGKYGKAFDPKKPSVRLTAEQRSTIWHENAGTTPMALPPEARSGRR